MTEQQIKRIQEAVNTPNTAIRCETEEEARMLFEATGWRWIPAEVIWRGSDRAYLVDSCRSCGWDRDYTTALIGKTIIPFSTLFTPEPCGLVKAFRAVGLDWLDEGNLFEFEGAVYRVDRHNLMRKNGNEWHTCRVNYFARMLNNPHKISPVRVWSEEEMDIAAAAIKMGFETVFKAQVGNLDFGWHDNIGTFRAHKLEGEMPELKPGECVALADIAGE